MTLTFTRGMTFIHELGRNCVDVIYRIPDVQIWTFDAKASSDTQADRQTWPKLYTTPTFTYVCFNVCSESPQLLTFDWRSAAAINLGRQLKCYNMFDKDRGNVAVSVSWRAASSDWYKEHDVTPIATRLPSGLVIPLDRLVEQRAIELQSTCDVLGVVNINK